MAHLTLAGQSDDGKRLLLVDDRGVEHTLAIDATLRAALRGEHARIGQLEIQMDSALRPRDIQARIRAGESPDAVAQAAQTTVDRVMPYASPVLAERAHVAQRAQRSSVRRRSGESGARTLGEAVDAHLRGANIDPATVAWDAWRREDGRWTLTASYAAGKKNGTATFTYDMRGSFVTMDDDDAKWLVGEAPAPREPGATGESRRSRRLSAVPGEQLPLGEDTLSMVTDEPTGSSGDEIVDALPEADVKPSDAESAAAVPAESESETTVDLGTGSAVKEEVASHETGADERADDTAAGKAGDRASDQAGDTPTGPAAEEPPVRKPARKGRGRASVPSWDEIMFGGGSGD